MFLVNLTQISQNEFAWKCQENCNWVKRNNFWWKSGLSSVCSNHLTPGRPQKFFRGWQSQLFANPCQIADNAMEMSVHDTLTLSTRLHHKENAPCYNNSHKQCASLAVIARYITIIFTIGYLSRQSTSFHRKFFNETTNYEFVLPRKTCQRLCATKAANIWDPVFFAATFRSFVP